MPQRSFIRPDFEDLEPYDPKYVACDVMISANENTYGLPEGVKDQMVAAVAEQAFNRYPDPMANGLRDAVAQWHGVGRDNVIIGNGGDELLFNLLFSCGGNGGVLVSCPPEFSIYALYARMAGMRHVPVMRDLATFEVDQAGVEAVAKDARIIIITSPNNPTGNLVDPAWVERLSGMTDALILVDEAYIDFARDEDSCRRLVRDDGNVAVLGTFSKAFALAGVRCGYILAPKSAVDAMSAVRQPYSVDVCAQAIATVAVRNRESFSPILTQIASERERMLAELPAVSSGIQVWPSAANFYTARIPGAHDVWNRLRDEYSVLVRDFSSTPGLEDCLRITVGTPEENDRLVAALAELVKG
ncbi:histidinol-phosphate transaminase [Slackia heliotrinireducens]|uniref:histidinol-phosphate transaminase n=1 Tax=Slackia heliotrinireducens TaxID=84110 RepID=UPI003316462E